MALTDDSKAKVAQAVQTLVNELNSFSVSPGDVSDVIVGELHRTHRTLQQDFIGTLKVTIEKYANECVANGFHDLRNDAAVSWAREVRKIQGGDALDAGTIKHWIFSTEQGFPLI